MMELENLNNEHEKLMHASDLMTTELTETQQLIHALENTVEDYEVLQEELMSLKEDYSRVEQELEESRERTKVSIIQTWSGEFLIVFEELSHISFLILLRRQSNLKYQHCNLTMSTLRDNWKRYPLKRVSWRPRPLNLILSSWR
jgi:molecular chaperone GrpE (heat shock protein)